jgi:hypothetical protein
MCELRVSQCTLSRGPNQEDPGHKCASSLERKLEAPPYPSTRFPRLPEACGTRSLVTRVLFPFGQPSEPICERYSASLHCLIPSHRLDSVMQLMNSITILTFAVIQCRAHRSSAIHMKKPQRSFVVEYKTGRRKVDSKAPSSIWGSLDLESVARDVETALPIQGEASKQPETPTPLTCAPAQLAPASTGTDMVESLASSVFGDGGVERNGNDQHDVGADAARAITVRKSGTGARRRRMPAGEPHSPERRQTAVDHNDEPDELEQLEREPSSKGHAGGKAAQGKLMASRASPGTIVEGLSKQAL